MAKKLELNPINKKVKGFLNTRETVGIAFLFFSVLTEFAAFMLSIEALFKARNPEEKLGCDLSATVSCGKVAESWQAELLHFGKYPVPNAFLGMIFEAVFITIAVLLAFGGPKLKLPTWFMNCSLIGNIGCFVFAVWLFYQSSFVILVLCPWCLTLFTATTFQLLFQFQYLVLNRNISLKESFCAKFDKFVENKLWTMVLVLVLVIIVGVLTLDIITIPERHNAVVGLV